MVLKKPVLNIVSAIVFLMIVVPCGARVPISEIFTPEEWKALNAEKQHLGNSDDYRHLVVRACEAKMAGESDPDRRFGLFYFIVVTKSVLGEREEALDLATSGATDSSLNAYDRAWCKFATAKILSDMMHLAETEEDLLRFRSKAAQATDEALREAEDEESREIVLQMKKDMTMERIRSEYFDKNGAFIPYSKRRPQEETSVPAQYAPTPPVLAAPVTALADATLDGSPKNVVQLAPESRWRPCPILDVSERTFASFVPAPQGGEWPPKRPAWVEDELTSHQLRALDRAEQILATTQSLSVSDASWIYDDIWRVYFGKPGQEAKVQMLIHKRLEFLDRHIKEHGEDEEAVVEARGSGLQLLLGEANQGKLEWDPYLAYCDAWGLDPGDYEMYAKYCGISYAKDKSANDPEGVFPNAFSNYMDHIAILLRLYPFSDKPDKAEVCRNKLAYEARNWERIHKEAQTMGEKQRERVKRAVEHAMRFDNYWMKPGVRPKRK